MAVEVLRIGQRLVRDDRVTTHAALVARALGASAIHMSKANPDIVDTIARVNRDWGGPFRVEVTGGWRRALKEKIRAGYCVVHLTMYGLPVGDAIAELAQYEDILVVIGAGKVPREVYELATHNVAVTGQPHSEIAALAVFLDRLGRASPLTGGRHSIIPTERGKTVETVPRD